MGIKILPQLKISETLVFSNADDIVTIHMYDSLSPAQIIHGNGLSYPIHQHALSAYITKLQNKSYQIIDKKVLLEFRFQKRYGTETVEYVSSSEYLVTTNNIELLEAFAPKIKIIHLALAIHDKDFLQLMGFSRPIHTDTHTNIAGKPSLDDVFDSKTNDYSLLEAVLSSFMAHNVNDSDISFLTDLEGTLSLRIVIPYHNSLDTINESLYGIDNQRLHPANFTTIGITIVDDGSRQPLRKKDLETLNNIPSSAIKIIRSDENIYCGQARNLGYINATEDVILTMDSDIVLERNYLANHLFRHHLYGNIITSSTRENITRVEFATNLDYLRQYYANLSPSKQRDSRYISVYKTQRGEMIVKPFEQTNYYREFGFGRQLMTGAERITPDLFSPIQLSLMLKGHNFMAPAQAIRAADYCAKDYMGWGDDDAFFGRKLVAAGAFMVPVVSTGTIHFAHQPRLFASEKHKIESLRQNVENGKTKASTVATTQIK